MDAPSDRRDADEEYREERRNIANYHALGAGDHHDTRLRCSAQSGLRRLDQARSAQALVGGAGGLVDGGLRGRPALAPHEPKRAAHLPWYAGEALDTVVLVEQGGRTTVTTTVLYESQEVRDAVLKSGMERGIAESYDKLAEHLASIA